MLALLIPGVGMKGGQAPVGGAEPPMKQQTGVGV